MAKMIRHGKLAIFLLWIVIFGASTYSSHAFHFTANQRFHAVNRLVDQSKWGNRIVYQRTCLFAEGKRKKSPSANDNTPTMSTTSPKKRRSSPTGVAQKDAEDAGISESEKQFRTYFRGFGKAELTYAELIGYPLVQSMIKEFQASPSDIEELWFNFVADSSSVSMTEAWDFLKMVEDLPDPEAERRWKKAFASLTRRSTSGTLSLQGLKSWSEMEQLKDEGGITDSELQSFFQEEVARNPSKSTNNELDLSAFLRVNRRIDMMLAEKERSDDQPNSTDSGFKEVAATSMGGKLSGDEVWSSSYELSTAFDATALKELREIYRSLQGIDQRVSKDTFSSWAVEEELLDLTFEEDKELLDAVWAKATTWDSQQIGSSAPGSSLSLDSFLRGYAQLEILYNELDEEDEVLDGEIDEAEDRQSDRTSTSSVNPTTPKQTQRQELNEEDQDQDEDEDDPVVYYREEFQALTKQSSVANKVTLRSLLQWQEIRDLLSDKAITDKQIAQLFSSLATKGKSASKEDELALDEAGFVTFNDMLDLLIESQSPSQPASSSSSLSSTTQKPVAREVPSALLASEQAMPLPKDSNTLSSSSNMPPPKNVESEEDENRLLEAIDAAEQLLTERSFSAFDKLFGADDDVRLQQLRNPANVNKPNTPVSTALSNSMQRLLSLSRPYAKIGCGSREPSPPEEELAALRSAFQDTVDSILASQAGPLSPAVAAAFGASSVDALSNNDIKRMILPRLNGRWRLLYTNSDMVRFYKGVSGLVNVFPGATFDGVDLVYNSDGVLSEATYLEEVKTPLLGSNVIKVAANYDIVRETSFMTNELALVLRSYVSKVNAGPFEYRAEENWKSLRSLAMNEIIYLDDDVLLLRNAGALRVFFVLERVRG